MQKLSLTIFAASRLATVFSLLKPPKIMAAMSKLEPHVSFEGSNYLGSDVSALTQLLC